MKTKKKKYDVHVADKFNRFPVWCVRVCVWSRAGNVRLRFDAEPVARVICKRQLPFQIEWNKNRTKMTCVTQLSSLRFSFVHFFIFFCYYSNVFRVCRELLLSAKHHVVSDDVMLKSQSLLCIPHVARERRKKKKTTQQRLIARWLNRICCST